MGLQLCRPLSGAVIRMSCAAATRYWPTSIVPPPFGSGYLASLTQCRPNRHTSIVPPPFGSGYILASTPAHIVYDPLQLCRPLSEAVIPGGPAHPAINRSASIVPPPFGSGYPNLSHCSPASEYCFNCAAPFRKRLSGLGTGSASSHYASIVPPPFGSGYMGIEGLARRVNGASIVPPPFGSGYPSELRP